VEIPPGAKILKARTEISFRSRKAGADPAREMFDPPAAADADTEVVQVCCTALAPSCHMQLSFDKLLTPRQAWLQVTGSSKSPIATTQIVAALLD